MIGIFESSIDYSKIGEYDKENLRFEITKAAISKETAVLSVHVTLNFVIPYGAHLLIKGKIKERMPMLSDVRIVYTYSSFAISREDAIKLAVPHIIEEINGSFASVTKTIRTDDVLLNGESLVLTAVGEMAVEKLNKDVAVLFNKIYKDRFGFDVKVSFVNDGEGYRRNIEQREKEVLEEAKAVMAGATQSSGNGNGAPKPQAPQSQPGSFQGGEKRGGWQRRDKYEPVNGNIIMGKAIHGEPVALTSITSESGTVVIEGTVFGKDSRTIKNDRKIGTLLVTDKKTSICVKFFCLPQKWEDVDSNIKSGTFVKIKGEAQWDTFENTLVVMAKDIEKGEVKKRKDNAPRKRVELHCHTKMSSMDGLNETKSLVATCGSWGFPALAITDHGVVQSFPDASHAVDKFPDMKIIYGMEGYVFEDRDCIDEEGNIDYKKNPTNHIILLAQNQTGLKNLYKLVSYSHLNYFYKRPRLPKSVIQAHREGLIIGSACEAGEVFRAAFEQKPEEEIDRIASFYDYLEIQPLINNQFMIENGSVADREGLKELNRKIIALGDKLGKPVVATTDSHYLEPEDAVYRQILMAGQGFTDEGGQGLYLRTTEEMLEEFSYLGEELAEKVVIDNPNMIADMIDVIQPVPSEKFPPKIENAAEKLREKCMTRAHELYGDPLPPEISERLEAELVPIIREGYAVMYIAAEMLVQKSLSDGYLVGSRGSVGSSFAATMAGITEVNPLPPHYLCPNCKNLEWGDQAEYDCGVDMPEKNCPVCGTKYRQEGFTIPFQTFLGFEADKEPDIDLNFAGEYQPVAHKYVDEIFGSKNVFKAGTIGTVADKTAYGFVMKYHEERGLPINKFEADRLAKECTGVKRTTGQHPGGIIIVPDDHEIYEFCPVQHPANDMKSDIITTHFDYHSIDQNLLKLDILGHDVPSIIRHLQDMTGLDPIKDVPLKDEKVNSIFLNCEALDIKDPDYRFVHGTFGIPEFGTKFTRQMLDDTQPTRFADFVRISGFSHGTDVWINNAQEFIKSGEATIKDAISTRDDIMNYLILKGLPKKKAFTIMEKVRKGKGVTDEEAELMADNDVPDWYIESCRRIKYMFPRAHAVAYVMMSYRVAYFKVYYPAEFYAAYFTTKVADFDADVILKGKQAVLDAMDAIIAKGKNATKKEEDAVIVYEVAYEMYARGYEFCDAILGESQATRFMVKDGKVLLPYVALPGVGESAAKQFFEENEKKPYETIEEAQSRSGINKTALEAMKNHGIFKGMPETDQLSLF
ncbi:MAG: PolC-type DNA polymerase III [Firmicutes bacterium]|nr:PolC-type DNA polymerase III [Bacillota bacterium]